MTTKIYVVVESVWTTGDVSGTSVTVDRVWFSHMSSNRAWLLRDCTGGFADRRAELDAAYPGGWEPVLLDVGAEIPTEIQHHFREREDADDS